MPSVNNFIRSDKIKLDVLFGAGDITVTNSHGLISPYNTIADIFDDDDIGDAPDYSFIALNANGADSFTDININNSKAPIANYLRLVVSIALAGNVVINEGYQDELIIEWDTKRTNRSNTPKVIPLNLGRKIEIKRIKINYTSFVASDGLDDPRLYGFHLYNVIRLSDSLEFNDSVLTTKAWNSSRYSGKQLSAAKINKFTPGDSTYGKTSVIQNYTRNIYIGNTITNGDEDNKLVNFKDFSYLTTNRYITVNEDDTITSVPIESFNNDSKVGFYQSFYDDFPVGGQCRVLITDNIVKTNTQKSYNIYSNYGQLKKIVSIVKARRFRGQNNINPITSSNYYNGEFSYLTVPGGLGSPGLGTGASSNDIAINDEEFIQRYYSGSLSLEGRNILLESDPQPFFERIINNSDKHRTFCTFVTPGDTHDEQFALRSITSASISGALAPSIRTNDITELATAEFRRFNYSSITSYQDAGDVAFTGAHQYAFKKTHPLKQNYLSIKEASNSQFGHDDRTDQIAAPDAYVSGGIAISYADDEIPSLLVNLKKSFELPESTNSGIGDTPFIIIPENLHPYIKDNILFFLTQAGIDVGGNTSTVIKINPSNRTLK